MAVALPCSVVAVTDTVGLPRESRTSCALRPTSRITSGKSKPSLRREWEARLHAEAVVEQHGCVRGRVQRGVQDDRDQVPAVARGGGDDAAARIVRQPRLQAG